MLCGLMRWFACLLLVVLGGAACGGDGSPRDGASDCCAETRGEAPQAPDAGAEGVAEPRPEPTVEPGLEIAAEPTVEPPSEPAAEPAPEPLPEPAAELPPDAAAEPPPEPAAEPPPDAGVDVGAEAEVAPPPGCEAVGGEIRLTNSAGTSQGPAIFWDGTAYVVAWADARTGNGDIYAVRVGAGGAKLGADNLVVAGAPETRGVAIAPAASGGGSLIVWEELDLGPSVSVNGRPLGADATASGAQAGIATTMTDEARPQLVGALGAVYAGWMDVLAGGSADAGSADAGSDAVGGGPPVAASMIAKLGATGAVAAPPASIRLGGGAPTRFPYLASNATRLAIAYTEGDDGAQKIRLGIFDGALVLQRDVVIRDLPSSAWNPSVAWDGARWVVAWEDLRSGAERVFFAAVAEDGTVSVPQPLHPTSLGDGNWPAVASDGTSSVVAYYAFPAGAEVLVAMIGADGSKRGGDVRVSSSLGSARFPAIAYSGSSAGAAEYGVVWQDTRFGETEIMFARVACR